MKMKVFCVVLFVILAGSCSNGQLISSVMDFLLRGERIHQLEQLDEAKSPRRMEFDFIIVGAGTAGCALASRLSENPNWNVLLLEAGQQENLLMDIPVLVNFLQLNPDVNWGYKPQSSNISCLAMNKNRCNWPRGKVMGGSSVLNYMIYTRGNRRDYDRWAALGNTGWSFADVLPYFIKVENTVVKNAAPGWRGRGGPITVSEVPWKSASARAFVRAGQEIGMPYVDYNGPTQVGVSYLQTSTKNGARASSNVGYLYPVKSRPNLIIRKMSMVTKVIIDPNTHTAIGVRYLRNKKYYNAFARKEVILSAGAINSPQLLMLSGVGPAKHLRKMKIEPIANLPVGYNLMDHTAPGALTIKVNVSTLSPSTFGPQDFIDYQHGKGPLTSAGGCESLVFMDLEKPNDLDAWPDIELLQIAGAIHSFDVFRQNFGIRDDLYNLMFGGMQQRRENAFMVFPMVLRPKSRGRITLKSKNPLVYPKINAGYFTDPEGHDLRVSVKGIKKTLEMLDTTAMRRINARVHDIPIPACEHLGFGTDAYWACHTQHFTFTIYHYSGTCKMGPAGDPTAVVDPRLRVHNINNLRVVDASIFPEIMAGHPNGPIFMIAEKAADMIKEDWNNYV